MAEKPRVKAPKQRTGTADESARRTRTFVIVAGIVALAFGLVGVAVAIGMAGGSGTPDTQAVRAKLDAAGCTLKVAPALKGLHSIRNPSGTSPTWNTDPPTSGPHYAVAAIFGIYQDEIEMARLVHNLEHGGIYILYGKDVSDSTVDELRSFYDSHKTGTIMAPLNRLGDEFVLGAWVVDGDIHNGFLAKCKTFDEDAVSTFFRALQFRGPERFNPSQLQPGL